MKIKFKNKVYFEKLNQFIKSGINHPVLIEELQSITEGGDRNKDAEFFCVVLHNEKAFADMLKTYYANEDLYEMFIRCDVYDEELYKGLFDSFRTKNIVEYFKHNNYSSESISIVNNGFNDFVKSYNEVFDYVENKQYNVIAYNELKKLDFNKEVLRSALNTGSKSCIASLCTLCKESESEEEISLFIERALSVMEDNAMNSRYHFVLKRFTILLLNEKIAPGIYDKYRLLFE